MPAAASATPTFTPPLASAFTTALAASFAARTSPATASAARTRGLAGVFDATTASARVATELFAATDPATSPRTDLGLIWVECVRLHDVHSFLCMCNYMITHIPIYRNYGFSTGSGGALDVL